MPTLAILYGIVIQIYWTNHPSPHFHARYGEFEAQVDIFAVSILEGYLPTRARRMVLEWTREHQDELMRAWQASQEGLPPERIAPLR